MVCLFCVCISFYLRLQFLLIEPKDNLEVPVIGRLVVSVPTQVSVHTNQLVNNRRDGLVKIVHLVLNCCASRWISTEHHATTREVWLNGGRSRDSRARCATNWASSWLVHVRGPSRY
ncbi:hypothetical protein D3C86_1679090 [compost metagenome]